MAQSSVGKRLQFMKSGVEEGLPESEGTMDELKEDAAYLRAKIEDIERINIPKLQYQLDEFEKRRIAEHKSLEDKLES